MFKVERAGASWDVATKRTVFIILVILGAGVLWISRPVIPLLMVSGIIAYVLSPIVEFARRLRIPRGISILMLYGLVLAGLVVLPLLMGPVLLRQLQVMTDFDVNDTASALLHWVTERFNRLPATIHLLGFQIPVVAVAQDVQENVVQSIALANLTFILGSLQQVAGAATSVVGSTAAIGWSLAGSVVQLFVLFVLTFCMSLYLTKDAPLVRDYVQGLFPRSFQPELAELLRRIGDTWTSFLRVKLMLSLGIGLVMWLVLELVGMPGALILAIVAGVLEIIPSLGPTLATVPAIMVALIQGSHVLNAYGIDNLGFALVTVALYFSVQQLENILIVPRVIGNSVNLHPIVVFCGVAVGFNLAGIWGAFFSVPLIASLRIIAGYVHAKLLDRPPFAEGSILPSPHQQRVMSNQQTYEPAPAEMSSD